MRVPLLPAVLVAFLAGAAWPAPTPGYGAAAGATPARRAPTPAELEAAAVAAEKRAAAARKAADAAREAAAGAAANLREAEANVAALTRSQSARAALPDLSAQQQAYAVRAAQDRLRMAQQDARQAELNASLQALQTPSANGVPSILNPGPQMQLQSAQQAVERARADLLAARQAQSMGTQAASLSAAGDAGALRAAETTLESARQIAASTARPMRPIPSSDTATSRRSLDGKCT